MTVTPTISTCCERLAAGSLSSRDLLEGCLDAITSPSGEGARAFIAVDAASARASADTADKQRRSGAPLGSLSGIPVSIKDLFDVAGQVTRAGSVVLSGAAPAERDAALVTALRKAGAILMGRTNMTEFAYSGLGLNPHYGTPLNPYDRATGRIPGGSSSGAAVSVSDGMAVAAIGTDTGGSVRIPAALCGLTGFKPTARRVAQTGMLPLSPSLDSIGWIAPSVDCCARLYSALSTGEPQVGDPLPLPGLILGVLQGYVLDGLEQPVAQAYQSALSVLARAGAHLVEICFAAMDDIPLCNRRGGFAVAEAYAWHRRLIEQHADRYDPTVLSRILPGRDIAPAEYRELVQHRSRIRSAAEPVFDTANVWLLPTVPWIAPPLAELVSSAEAYFAANGAMLRNPSIFNFLDACALSMPCHRPGEAPVGLMLAARGGDDGLLLRTASAVEEALAQAGCAIPGERPRNPKSAIHLSFPRNLPSDVPTGEGS